jgi:hypothetical protein
MVCSTGRRAGSAMAVRWYHGRTELQKLCLCRADHPITEIREQLRRRVIAVDLQERGAASVEVEHPRLLLRCDYDGLHGHTGQLRDDRAQFLENALRVGDVSDDEPRHARE